MPRRATRTSTREIRGTPGTIPHEVGWHGCCTRLLQQGTEDNEMQLSGPESVIGKAMVVHADQDDFESQPSGNSGARVGCGEIVETAGT